VDCFAYLALHAVAAFGCVVFLFVAVHDVEVDPGLDILRTFHGLYRSDQLIEALAKELFVEIQVLSFGYLARQFSLVSYALSEASVGIKGERTWVEFISGALGPDKGYDIFLILDTVLFEGRSNDFHIFPHSFLQPCSLAVDFLSEYSIFKSFVCDLDLVFL
jgi:hypothetical protein